MDKNIEELLDTLIEAIEREPSLFNERSFRIIYKFRPIEANRLVTEYKRNAGVVNALYAGCTALLNEMAPHLDSLTNEQHEGIQKIMEAMQIVRRRRDWPAGV